MANLHLLTSRETYANMDLDKSYAALFEVLWYSQLPCFDVLDVTSTKDDEYGDLPTERGVLSVARFCYFFPYE